MNNDLLQVRDTELLDCCQEVKARPVIPSQNGSEELSEVSSLNSRVHSPAARRAIRGAISALRAATSALELIEEGGEATALAEAERRAGGAIEYISQARGALCPDA